jgi:hypothetical protein
MSATRTQGPEPSVVPARRKPVKALPSRSPVTAGTDQFQAVDLIGGSGWIGLMGVTGTGPSTEFMRRLMTWHGGGDHREKEGSLAADQILLNLWAPQQFPLKR